MHSTKPSQSLLQHVYSMSERPGRIYESDFASAVHLFAPLVERNFMCVCLAWCQDGSRWDTPPSHLHVLMNHYHFFGVSLVKSREEQCLFTLRYELSKKERDHCSRRGRAGRQAARLVLHRQFKSSLMPHESKRISVILLRRGVNGKG